MQTHLVSFSGLAQGLGDGPKQLIEACAFPDLDNLLRFGGCFLLSLGALDLLGGACCRALTLLCSSIWAHGGQRIWTPAEPPSHYVMLVCVSVAYAYQEDCSGSRT
jgi:hypothetical protein